MITSGWGENMSFGMSGIWFEAIYVHTLSLKCPVLWVEERYH